MGSVHPEKEDKPASPQGDKGKGKEKEKEQRKRKRGKGTRERSPCSTLRRLMALTGQRVISALRSEPGTTLQNFHEWAPGCCPSAK